MNCKFLSGGSSSPSVAPCLTHSVTLQGLVSVSSDPTGHRLITPPGNASWEGFLTVSGMIGGNHGRTVSHGRAAHNDTASPAADKR